MSPSRRNLYGAILLAAVLPIGLTWTNPLAFAQSTIVQNYKELLERSEGLDHGDRKLSRNPPAARIVACR